MAKLTRVKKFRAGILGVSGYGGGETLRIVANHPNLDLIYVSGESSAGTRLIERYPGLDRKLGELAIQKWDPALLPDLDVLFASLPTGESLAGLANVPTSVKVVDIGGDHRFKPGWTYGLADIWPGKIREASRVANPGCFPAATLTALAPLFANKLCLPEQVIIDAKTGVSGAGRGGGNTFGYAEVNEDLAAYGLLKHVHVPEMNTALEEIGGTQQGGVSVVFTPHLVPMTRGIYATVYLKGSATTEKCLSAARDYYQDRPFVRVVDKAPHSKWATGTNQVFISYAADPARNLIIALGALDNLGKGAAGQAVQNANLMLGLDAETGLLTAPLYP